jgi:hypothetical protein
MALASLTPSRPAKGPTCEVCKALAAISEAEAKALRGHLANPAWRYTELSDALASDEDTPLNLPAFSLARHARGQCQARERLRGA